MNKKILLDSRQKKLFEFVKQCHGSQLRKYSDDPYWHHLLEVARIAQMAKRPIQIHKDDSYFLYVEIALCHDLFEDTKCTRSILKKFLLENGYDSTEAVIIVIGTKYLTDKYTKEDYPLLNRATRKEMEADRLGKIPYWAQTVKMADMISNTSSIVSFDSNFARVYIPEKKRTLNGMRLGDLDILIACCHSLWVAEATLANPNYETLVKAHKEGWLK